MRVILLGFVVIAFLAVGLTVEGQTTRSVTSVGRRLDDFNRQGDKAARDDMAREMRPRKPTKEELETAARIKAETKEDLEGLAESYNDIVVKLKSGEVQPSFVLQAASKVNKHANRLKLNIAFPKPEKEDESKAAAATGDSRKLLLDLCHRIYEFLTDPMIENPQVLDIEAAGRARLSLDSVIALSEQIVQS